MKCAGTYQSLASRYIYQMAYEIDLLVDALKEGGHQGEDHALKVNDRCNVMRGDVEGHLSNNVRAKSSHTRQCQAKRKVSFAPISTQGTRPLTAPSNRGKPRSCSSTEWDSSSPPENSKPFSPRLPQRNAESSEHIHSIRHNEDMLLHWLMENSCHSRKNADLSAFLDVESSNEKILRWLKDDSRRPRRCAESLAHLNLRGQNEEVLRWLMEEIKRSQSLIDRSRHMHDAELDNAKNEVEKVKRAAKLLVKAVHKKGKEKAANLEANAELERRRRLQSQEMIENLIQSHSSQMDRLKKGLRVGSSPDDARVHPGGEVQDDKTAVSFSPSESSDLTSILNELAEESYRRTGVVQP